MELQGKHTFMTRTRNSNSKYLPKEMKTYSHNDLSTNIYNGFIHNNPKLKSIVTSISR